MFSGFVIPVGMPNAAIFHKDAGADGGLALGVGVSGESTGPGDVAVAIRIQGIAPLAENPLGTAVGLAQSEVVGGNILFGFREAFLGNGELVHEGETEVMLFAGEIDLEEAAGKLFGGFPTNLPTEAGFVPGGLDGFEVAQAKEKNGFEEIPIFGADG